MQVTVLIENLQCASKDLKSEHGLALYIQKDNHHILFDTGKTDKFILNARKMQVPLEEIETVIISHAHHDHTGGLSAFLRINKKAKVYMKKQIFQDYFFSLMGLKKAIGIEKNILSHHAHRICFIDTLTEITKGVYIFTDIEKYYALPAGNSILYTKNDNNLVTDTFEHELLTAIEEPNGISIFTGCGHQGVANMIRTVKKSFPQQHIKAVIGGFHLISIPLINLSGSKTDITTIAKVLKDEKIQKIYTGHCTGKSAFKILKKLLGNKIQYLQLGKKIDI
jgi:7,8-dihydropterin-6-yl-methyl-4-(beta-D-ribofuranosyl)aminobenzene 5'-phosphate synthase